MNEQLDIEDVLRASLAENASRAPLPGALANDIVAAAVDSRPGRLLRRPSGPRWRTWALPLIAAGSVAALVGGIVATSQVRHQAAPPATTVAPSSTAPLPPPTVAPSTGTAPSVLSTPTSTGLASAPAGGPVPASFKVADLTFVGADQGWALGRADCLSGGGSGCSAILRTTDGGQHWVGIPTPPKITVTNCSPGVACVDHIRFANSQVGYVFGPDALFMTTDGGFSWQAQTGGAQALETLDGNVIRITSQGSCAPGCDFGVQTAAIGSSAWTTGLLPGRQQLDTVSLIRSGNQAYLAEYGNPAGGAGAAQSVLLTSADDGTSWVNRGEPCPQGGALPETSEVDGTALTAAADGSLTVLCTPRGAQTGQFTITSTDGGVSFSTPSTPVGSALQLVGAASASVLFVSSGQLYRSTDGGASWQPVAGTAGGAGSAVNPGFLGFETARTGRWVGGDPATVWTTADGGATWMAHTFR